MQNCDSLPKDSEAEREICNFYIKVIKSMHKLYGTTFLNILTSLSTVKNFKFGVAFDGVPFKESVNRFHYIYEYCFIRSIVMCDRFSNMLKSNPTISEKIISMKELRLCLLGGGPGFEAVSICKVISVLRKQSDIECPPQSLNITIIDVCSEWEKDAQLIITAAQSDICSSSNIKIDFQFIAADLTADFTEDVTNALKKSHIVTMCKFVSDVKDLSPSKSRIHQMTEKIVKCMNFRACLFFLENGGSSLFKKTEEMINEFAQTLNIYQFWAPYSSHTLDINSVEMISESLKSIFYSVSCASREIISCSAWLKIKDMTNVQQLSSATVFISTDSAVPYKLKDKDRKVKVKKIYQTGSEFEDHSLH